MVHNLQPSTQYSFVEQHAPQLDVRLVVLPMSQHWIVVRIRCVCGLCVCVCVCVGGCLHVCVWMLFVLQVHVHVYDLVL